jgi:hypothetical protein
VDVTRSEVEKKVQIDGLPWGVVSGVVQ